MNVVSLNTELSIAAERARGLAATPEVMFFVLSPIVSFSVEQPLPDGPIRPGFRARGRLRWFGVIPSWIHEIEIVGLDGNEISTREHGGPVRTWNHRLIFEPLTPDSCRYTDQIEIDGGVTGWFTKLFIRMMFRHRYKRWQTLAAVAAAFPDTAVHD